MKNHKRRSGVVIMASGASGTGWHFAVLTWNECVKLLHYGRKLGLDTFIYRGRDIYTICSSGRIERA